jgi:O-acetylserine/cysteine efflux transporter
MELLGAAVVITGCLIGMTARPVATADADASDAHDPVPLELSATCASRTAH